MGLDQYLYAKKYLGFWNKEATSSIKLINKIHDFLEIPKLDPKKEPWELLDTFPRVQYLELLVAQWRKDYWVEDFFEDKIENKDNGGTYYISKDILKELCDQAEKVLEESDSDWQRINAECTIEMIAPLLADRWADFDFFYSSNW